MPTPNEPTATGPNPLGPAPNGPVSLRTLRRMAEEGRPFACLTCYDATTARWLARGGVHVLLVGDTAAEMVLGFERTIDAPLDFMIDLTAGVKRGAPDRVVMADMPFMSYQAGADAAVANAGRFLVEGAADVVKLELDASFAPLVDRLTRAGVPICAHVGSRPQRAALTGGYGSAGRTAAEARRIVEDALALEAAGAVMLLAEAVPDEVTAQILQRTSVPLIGIGAGPACHGQVLVLQDLLGMSDAPPRFAQPLAAMGPMIAEAGARWADVVARRAVGGTRYTMKTGEAAGFKAAPGPIPRSEPKAKPRRGPKP